MKIGIDLRSLHSGGISGVENYILNLLECLLEIDTANSYKLFYNSSRGYIPRHFQFINSQVIATKIPNRLLNLSLKFLHQPKFERLLGDVDCIFLPNANQFALRATTKLALTVHDLSPVVTPDFYNLKRRLWHSFLNMKKVVGRADIIFAVSEFTKQDLMHYFNVPEHKIKVVYPGVDHGAFNPQLKMSKLREARNMYGLPAEYILFLSTVEPRKNLIGLIEAFEKLDAPSHLVIAGKMGWKYKKILDKIATSKKRRFIKYLGYVHEKDKPPIIKLAEVVAYPSFYEGFGFVPLEAMAVGVPVVTSQVTSVPEVVEDAALLVDPYNTEDMAYALKQAITNSTLRQQLIAKGLAQAQKFTWQKSAKQILEGLESLK